MTSSYDSIYSRFLMKIRDYDFASLSEPNATEEMLNWLHSSLSEPYIFRIFDATTFTADDEIAELSYTLINPINEYHDQNFVEELLAYQMVVEWVMPHIHNTTLVNQMITNSKESKWYSQQQHLGQLRELRDDAEYKVRSMLRDRGYISNSYLGKYNGKA